jgi:hypothetical protein
MLFTTRLNNLVAACPRLSRVWIKTGNPKIPLKGVWFDESKLHEVVSPNVEHEGEIAELAEDHLCFAA